LTAEEGADQTVQVAQESQTAQKNCCCRKAGNCFGHLIVLPSYRYFFLQQRTFPISRHTPQNKDKVKPTLTATFLSQTRNLMCSPSAVSEGTNSSAVSLWKMEPLLVLFLACSCPEW